MDQRRQGMICFGLGLGMLSGFAWFETTTRRVDGSSNPITLASGSEEFTASETLERVDESECLRFQYRGHGELESLAGKQGVTWEVNVFRLARGEDGLTPYIVHLRKERDDVEEERIDWLQSNVSVTACWRDRRGRVVRSIVPPGAPTPDIDPAAFLMPLPRFASIGHVRMTEGSDGSRWHVEARIDEIGASDQIVVDVDTYSVAQRVEQIDRHMRFWYDRQSHVMLTMELYERGHWRQKKGDSWSHFELVGSSTISSDRIVAMTADLGSWDTLCEQIREAARRTSIPPSPPLRSTLPQSTFVSADSRDPTRSHCHWLDQMPAQATTICESMEDPLMRRGVAAGLFSLQASRLKLIGERSKLEDLHRDEPIMWSSSDLSGVTRSWAEYRGRPLVMSFLCRGTPHATRTIQTVAELRRRFPEDQLAVLGFATTFSRENAELISRAIGPTVPIFHDIKLAERLKMFSIGKSVILLLDPLGRPQFIHTWQPLDLVEDICRQIEEIRSPPTLEGDTYQQVTLTRP